MDKNQPRPGPIGAIVGRPSWVGRTWELGVLDDMLTSLRAGMGGCVLVEGPPGIGKTSLVSEAVRAADSDNVLVLRGSADEFCVSLPFQLITEALRPVQGVEPAQETGSLWGAGARDPLAAGVQEALARVERACATQPVVLIVSDLQWADEASLTVLGSLIRLTAQMPLLLAGELTTGSTRDEVHQLRRAITARGAATITLGPLSDDDTVLLAEHFLAAPVSDDVRALTLETGGNPLFVRELIAAMVRERRIGLREGSAHLVGGETEGSRLPSSLGAAIADRVGYLAKDTLEALRAASMLGTTFEAGELSTVLDWPVERVIEALDEATATGVLRDAGIATEFYAPLLRHAVYASIPHSVRGLQHRHTARKLHEGGWPVERVAAHLALAGGVADEWTIDWLCAWGTALLYRAPKLAREVMQHALEALGWNDSRREPLESVLAMAAYLRGDPQESEELARRVLARAKDVDHAGEMACILAYMLANQARTAEGLDLVTSVTQRWELPPAWQARLGSLHGLILVLSGTWDEAVLRRVKEARKLGRELGDARAIAYAWHVLSLCYVRQDRYAESRAAIEAGLVAAADDPQLTDIRLILLCNVTTEYADADELDRAWESARTARKIAIETGTTRLHSVLSRTAILAYDSGAWDEALADLETAGEATMVEYLAVPLYGLTALIKLRRGELDAAQVYLDRIGEPGQLKPPVSFAAEDIWRARLIWAHMVGRQDEVRSILRRACDDAFLSELEDSFRLLAPGVRLALSMGKQDLAADLVSAAHRKAERDSRPRVHATALVCQGLFDSDPGPLHEALAYYRSVGRVANAAGCAEDLSVVLAGSGDMGGAKAAMREAAEGFLALGAAGDLDRADARWCAVGLRRGAPGRRQRPTTGWDSLTPTEQRVAEFVADGLSNPDIGERLFSSRRTIQTHVTHILAKLGLRSRNEVAHAIAGRPRPATAS
ncbi:AAA family ATPase [Streptomyces sp. NPDC020681]|uniref:helix-turn-helix transcriptional regulator n=1 Tax=Streptomyces sp. NPDC020681 TaxID=3365083 RepID=UPI00379C71EF